MRDWSNGAALLARLALVAAFVVPMLYVGWLLYGKAGMMLAILFAAPLAAKLLAKPLIELVHEGFSWLANQPMQEWQGSYYAFDDVQVRIYEVDGELWFTVPDILTAIGLKRLPPPFLATHRSDLRRIPGSVLQALPARFLEPLLAPLRQPLAGRFLLWAQRDVVRPWERKTGR